MKILLVNKFHYIKGGSETYYFSLADLLRARGHEVIFFSMKDEKNVSCPQEPWFVDHVDFNAAGNPARTAGAALHLLYSREAGRKIGDLIDRERPDIIHLNIFQSQLTASVVDAAKKRGIPLVYTAHDLKSICPNYLMMHHRKICEDCLDGHYWHCFRNGCMKDSRAKSLLASMEAYVYKVLKTYRKIDWVITPSAFYKGRMEKAGVFSCPIEHIRNFLPAGTDFEAGGAGGDYFLYFGRLSREKGILTLVKAFAESGVEKKLLIAGTGPEEEDIRRLISELGQEESISLVGFKRGKELRHLVAGAACVCLPSEWYENGPYSIMEAQALGRPVIVSSNGGLPELVEDGRTGLIARPGDAGDLAEKIRCMAEAEMDPVLIRDRAASMYDANQYASHVLDIYRKLTEQR